MWLGVCFGLLGEVHPPPERAHVVVLATIRLENAATISHISALEQDITIIAGQDANSVSAYVSQPADVRETDLLLRSGDTRLTECSMFYPRDPTHVSHPQHLMPLHSA